MGVAGGGADDTAAAATAAAADADAGADEMKGTLGEVGRRMQRFVGMAKLKRMALNVLAYELTQSDIGNLRAVFETIDADKTGKLSVGELKAALVDQVGRRGGRRRRPR